MASSWRGGGIFISYRREETAAHAGRLYDRLSDHFGEDRVFMDVDSIAIGVDFTRELEGALSGCKILLVLIGRDWSAVTDGTGRRRLDDPDDFVRVEIETALQRDIRVVPVLVDGAGLPRAGDLPPGLQPLTKRQALVLSNAGFRSEVSRLIAAVDEVLGAEPGRGAAPSGGGGQVTAQAQVPTRVVDAYGRGDFTTVSEAIRKARPGDRILVRPGLYEEGLVVDKPLEILGDGRIADIEIRARGAHALSFRASVGRVANLTLRQAGGEGIRYGVDITRGRLDLEGCDISSQSGACVGIHGGADPRLRGNRIHDGKPGVFVYDSGLGTLEDNDITGNALSGVAIKTGGNPTVRGNRIHDNKGGGVYVYDSGLGTLEGNDITGNGRRGVEIATGGNPTVRGNRINRNGDQGIWIRDGGRGVVEDNDLTGNAKGAWLIAQDCQANVTRVRNKE